MVIWFSLEKYPSVRNSKEQKKRRVRIRRKKISIVEHEVFFLLSESTWRIYHVP
jgi:hypothetical protein